MEWESISPRRRLAEVERRDEAPRRNRRLGLRRGGEGGGERVREKGKKNEQRDRNDNDSEEDYKILKS